MRAIERFGIGLIKIDLRSILHEFDSYYVLTIGDMMKRNVLSLLFTFSFSFLAQAQTGDSLIPVLAKSWQGTTSETSINASSKKPKVTTQDIASSLTILKQDGRHIEFIYKNANYEAYEIGTISADGKLLEIAYKGGSGSYVISNSKLAGCGAGRIGDGLFSNWFNSYYAWCDELIAVK